MAQILKDEFEKYGYDITTTEAPCVSLARCNCVSVRV
jgi:hypothetical protein